MRKLKRYYMSRFTRRQRKRLKRIFRNAALRGSVLGALLMMVIPAQVMGGTKSAVVMCSSERTTVSRIMTDIIISFGRIRGNRTVSE